MKRTLIFVVCMSSLAAASGATAPRIEAEAGHAKVISTNKDDRLCAEWDGRRKCVTAQQIYYIGAKDRP